MDTEKLRIYGKQMVEFVANYWDNIRARQPLPDVDPGYISNVVADRLAGPDDLKDIFDSLENIVLKGTTNWNHPRFFAYFPSTVSYEAVLGDILSDGINAVGYSWRTCPSLTELEMRVLDWLVDILGLPEIFKGFAMFQVLSSSNLGMMSILCYFFCLENSHPGQGSGTIQTTASEATMMAILCARARMVDMIKHDATLLLQIEELKPIVADLQAKCQQNSADDKRADIYMDAEIISPTFHDPAIFHRFIAYCSDQAHSSVEKGAMLCGVKLRKLRSCYNPEVKNYALSKETLETAIKEDRARGLIPFIMVATIGTTCTCAIDRLDEIGPICSREFIYLHVDAAYAASNEEYNGETEGRRQWTKDATCGMYTGLHCGILTGATVFGHVGCTDLEVSSALKPCVNVSAKYLMELSDIKRSFFGTRSFLSCPEHRHISSGVQYADSFNFNAHKAFFTNFDVSPLWFKDGAAATKYFKIGDDTTGEPEVKLDTSHVQMTSGRRFRALKLYFVIRHLGIEFIQKKLRRQVELGSLFAKLIAEDDDFELFVPPFLGLVCFRTKKGTNQENKDLCNAINEDHRIHLVPAEVCFQLTPTTSLRPPSVGRVNAVFTVHGVYYLRLALCSEYTNEEDIKASLNVCKEVLANLRLKQK